MYNRPKTDVRSSDKFTEDAGYWWIAIEKGSNIEFVSMTPIRDMPKIIVGEMAATLIR